MSSNIDIANQIILAGNLSRRSLYDIRAEHQLLILAIEEAEGVIDEGTDQALTLNREDFESKAISYANAIQQQEDTEDAIRKQIDRLTKRLATTVKLKDTLSKRLRDGMIQFGVPRIKTDLLTISLRKSKAVVITNLDDLPSVFLKTPPPPLPNKKAIKKAITGGQDIPGAEIVERQNLQII